MLGRDTLDGRGAQGHSAAATEVDATMWRQALLTLAPRSRGLHLITDEVTRGVRIDDVRVGMLHLFLQHTSASLTINENADPDVRIDLEAAFERLAPEDAPYTHVLEGPDDMPAHVKASLYGVALTIPIGSGRLLLGTWQGICLCEHRDRGGPRRCVATVWGEQGGSA